MVLTGLEGLDRVLGGDGFPDRSTILAEGPPGVGKEAIGYWFIRSGILQGDYCLYVTRLAVSEVKQDISAFGADAEAEPAWMAADGGELKCDVSDLASLSVKIKDALKNQPEGRRVRIVTDVLSSLLMLHGPEIVYRFLSQLLAEVKMHNAVLVATLEDGMHPPQVIAAMEQLFDGVMELRLYEKGLKVLPLLRIRRCAVFPLSLASSTFPLSAAEWRSKRMPDSSLLFRLALTLIATFFFVSSAYWAFIVRRALAAPLYRRQALSVGIVGAYFAVLWLSSPFTNPLLGSAGPVSVFAAGTFFLGIIVIFAWIDGSMRVVRRADPLRRDTLRWSKLRIVLWVAIGADVVAFAGNDVRYALTGVPPGISDNFGFLASFLAILILGAPALFVSALRSKDGTLRKNLGWFGLFVATVLGFAEIGYLGYVLGILSTSPSGSQPPVLILAAISFLPVLGGYALYRSARSLVPMNRMPRTPLRDSGS